MASSQAKPRGIGHPFKNSSPELSERIKNLLRDSDVNYEKLARFWGVSKATVSRRINDPSTITEWEARMLCDHVLGIDQESLIDGNDSAIGLPASIISHLYRSLSDEDKYAVSHILARLAGPQAMHDAYQRELNTEAAIWVNEKSHS